MRSSRQNYYGQNYGNKKPDNGAGIKAAIIVCVCVLIYFIAAGSVGQWLAEEVAAPVFEFFEQGSSKDEQSDTVQTSGTVISESETDNNAQEDIVQQKIELPDLTLFALQTGVYSVKENADEEAQKVRESGGAGYILNEDNMRVITRAYFGEEAAQEVQNKLLEGGTETWLYEIKAQGPSFNIKASQKNIDKIQLFFDRIEQARDSLPQMADKLESGEMTVDDVLAGLEKIKEGFESSTEDMQSMEASGDDIVIKMEELSKALTQECTLDTDEGQLACNLRYAGISCTALYRDFINGLGGQQA